MARGPRIAWNIAGFKAIRKGDEVRQMLDEVVDDILAGLGEGYEGDVQQGRSRLRGGIRADSWEAIRDNEEHNSLLRELAAKQGDI